MARSFVERWFAEDATCDVYWNDELARFEVVSGDRIVFHAPVLVEVLRWGMGVDGAEPASSVLGDERAVEVVPRTSSSRRRRAGAETIPKTLRAGGSVPARTVQRSTLVKSREFGP